MSRLHLQDLKFGIVEQKDGEEFLRALLADKATAEVMASVDPNFQVVLIDRNDWTSASVN